MHSLKTIQSALTTMSSKEVADSVARFVPGSQKVYGVKMPELNLLAKQFSKDGFDLAEALWEAGAFEEKILAAKMLERISKTDPARAMVLVERFSSGMDNWAVCDAIGMQSLKAIRPSHHREIFALAGKLNQSSNLWEKRLSLVLVEWYTRFTSYHPAIDKLVKPLERDKEYYVKKAVEWIKRNMKKGK